MCRKTIHWSLPNRGKAKKNPVQHPPKGAPVQGTGRKKGPKNRGDKQHRHKRSRGAS